MKRQFIMTLVLAGLFLSGGMLQATTIDKTLVSNNVTQTMGTTSSNLGEKEGVTSSPSPSTSPMPGQETGTGKQPIEGNDNQQGGQPGVGNQVILTLNTTKALVNGQETTLLSPPTVIQNTTLLPLRFVANEVVGAQVDWDAKTQTVTITKNGTVVQVTVGSQKAFIDGLEVTLEVPPVVQAGVTLLPVRFISEAFDIQVAYDQVTKVITLTEQVKDTTPNQKPIASFKLPQNYIAGQEVTILSTSTDPDGDAIVDQLWSVSGSTTVTNKQISNIFKKPRAGSYVIGLQVQDARGLWSDWTYETVIIEPNKAPVINGFTATKASYGQGEKLDFTYTYDNETWETVKEGKWTYRSTSESPNRATLGKPDVLFSEGDYIVTLYLDDAYGNRSEGVETRVHITSEVKMSEWTYRFTQSKIGSWIDNFSNTNYLSYKDVVVDKSDVKGTLIMSDSPEVVAGEGLLYRDKINGTGRLLVHHINGIKDPLASSKTQRLVVIMRNETLQPITVTLTNKVFKGPVEDTLRAGQVALQAYYTGVPAETITLAPGESTYIYDKNWAYNQCITGHVDVQATGAVTFLVAALNKDHDVDSIETLPYFPADGAHYSGTYDTIAKNYHIVLTGQEAEKLNIGVINTGEWVTGYDERTMLPVQNTGNFGVSYYITVTALEDTGVILNNRGGTFKGAIKWNNQVYNMPIDGTFSGTTTKAAVVGVIKKGETVTLEYILPNGSAAPTLIGFIPKSLW